MLILDENLRLRIYRLAVNGKCQRTIGSILCLSRQDVYYHIKFLVENGYLTCKNPCDQVKVYGPTDKSFYRQQGSKKNGRRGRYDHCHGIVCRVHQIGYICDIIKLPGVNIRWEHNYKNNGTSYFDKHWDTDLGRVTIRMITTKLGSKIVFWLPEKYLDEHQLEHWGVVEPRYLNVFYNEFQKRYDCRLGPVSRYQKPEFAFEESPEFLFLAQKYNISNGSSWVDESEGSPEWETDDVNLARVRLELPERVLRLESMVSRMDKSISRIESSIDRLLVLFEGRPVLVDEYKDVV